MRVNTEETIENTETETWNPKNFCEKQKGV